MSTKYPGGIITKNYVAPTPSSASGVWTLEQQEQAQKAGIWPFGGPFNYIEDVFSTYLYTGTGPSAGQTITNNIDLSTKGGMTWIKNRTDAGTYPTIVDTVRGATKELYTNQTVAQGTVSNGLTAFTTSGFTLGIDTAGGNVNYAYSSPSNFVSWSFAKATKFFDVVTYTGNGTATNNISHNLGSVPGFIVVKCTSAAGYRWVCAASDNSGNYLYLTLNTTFASDASTVKSNIANSTTFNPGYMGVYFDGGANVSGETYVAYLFASNAGGFGLTGTDNVISCGSFTTDGSAYANVNLGYEPQMVIVKRTDGAGNWRIQDNMRGMATYGGQIANLYPNLSDAEGSGTGGSHPTATGFESTGLGVSQTYIYIAIRRGPMKVPTDGTKVFKPTTGTVSVNSVVTTGFATDMVITAGTGAVERGINDRLRGFPITNTGTSPWLVTQSTAAEANYSGTNTLFNATNTTFQQGYYFSGAGAAQYSFLRAPSFFDEVCYTGTGSTGNAVAHNLGVVPELMIVRGRTGTVGSDNWNTLINISSGGFSKVFVNLTDAALGPYTYASNAGLASQPTSTTFTVNNTASFNNGSTNYVAYLFATCAGVSKVGSYTGNGSTQAIACGFAGGARFVLIKRTDSTGGWYVYDTARGMTTLTDPYLFLNSTAAESATLGSVTTTAGGFTVDATILAAINTNAASYIFLAIA